MEARESSRRRGDSSTSKTRASGTSTDKARDASKESSKESKVNWKKYVTLNPPNLVKFDIVDQDLQRVKPLKAEGAIGPASADGQDWIEAADAKAESFIEILNKSDHYILFKVSQFIYSYCSIDFVFPGQNDEHPELRGATQR